MLSEPEFLVSRDGTSIAYWRMGEGDTALLYTNGFATSHFYWWEIFKRFDGRMAQITWDLKGHGRSGPAHDLKACTIPDSADDLVRVLDACGVEKAVLLGFSLGSQIILETYRLFPDRVAALVPVLGTYERPFDQLFHPKIGQVAYSVFGKLAPPAADTWLKLTHHALTSPYAHQMSQFSGMIGSNINKATMAPFYEHFEDIDGPTWAAMGLACQEHSAKDMLPTIDVPTLIVAGGRDVFTPSRMSMHMERVIPDAKMLFLPNATHAGLMEYPGLIGEAIDKFLENL